MTNWLKNFLPYEDITYNTKLKEEEILNRLIKNTEPRQTFRFGISSNRLLKPYEGEIYKKHFNIKRVTSYRNNFLPEIKGTIRTNLNKTQISLKFRLPNFVLAFVICWCSLAGLASIALFIQALLYDLIPITAALIPLLFLLFGYAFSVGIFKFENSKSKEDFQKLFLREMNK